jgi:tetratricopeptide (TPR) repeat protein
VALNCCGSFLYLLGELEAAVEALKRSAVLEPSLVNTRTKIGTVLAEIGDEGGAARAFAQAVSLADEQQERLWQAEQAEKQRQYAHSRKKQEEWATQRRRQVQGASGQEGEDAKEAEAVLNKVVEGEEQEQQEQQQQQQQEEEEEAEEEEEVDSVVSFLRLDVHLSRADIHLHMGQALIIGGSSVHAERELDQCLRHCSRSRSQRRSKCPGGPPNAQVMQAMAMYKRNDSDLLNAPAMAATPPGQQRNKQEALRTMERVAGFLIQEHNIANGGRGEGGGATVSGATRVMRVRVLVLAVPLRQLLVLHQPLLYRQLLVPHQPLLYPLPPLPPTRLWIRTLIWILLHSRSLSFTVKCSLTVATSGVH